MTKLIFPEIVFGQKVDGAMERALEKTSVQETKVKNPSEIRLAYIDEFDLTQEGVNQLDIGNYLLGDWVIYGLHNLYLVRAESNSIFKNFRESLEKLSSEGFFPLDIEELDLIKDAHSFDPNFEIKMGRMPNIVNFYNDLSGNKLCSVKMKESGYSKEEPRKLAERIFGKQGYLAKLDDMKLHGPLEDILVTFSWEDMIRDELSAIPLILSVYGPTHAQSTSNCYSIGSTRERAKTMAKNFLYGGNNRKTILKNK